MRHHHADIAGDLALDTCRMGWGRRLSTGQQRGHDIDELRLGDRTAPQFEIDLHVIGNGRRSRERVDIGRMRVDDGCEFPDIAEIAQGLNAACSRAGADGDENLRAPPHILNALRVVRRRHRPLDERHIVDAPDSGAHRLGKVGDVDCLGDRKQFVLAIEQAQLATVAGREFPDSQAWLFRRHVRSPAAPTRV